MANTRAWFYGCGDDPPAPILTGSDRQRFPRPDSQQRRTGSVVPGAPIISHEKDWGMVAPAMAETIADERQRRHPIRKQTRKRRKKEK